ncbi:hypothetical protein [Rhizobium sp. 21-4511-3d]
MKRTTPLIRKAQRGSRSIVGGEELLKVLTSGPYITALEAGVEEEVPPVSKISHMLKERFPDEVPDLKAMPVRQFIGSAVRAILSERGYALDESGIRIPNDPIFTTGSTYRKIEEEDDEEDFLERFVEMLSPSELRRLQILVKAAL